MKSLQLKVLPTQDTTANDGNYTRSAGSVDGLYILLAALNIFLSITASLTNALILIALHEVTSIYRPKQLLFRCLAVTDLCVDLISQPLFDISVFAFPHNRSGHYLEYVVRSSNHCFNGSIDININCNKCGQTSRSDHGAEIPTCCNIKTSTSARNLCLDTKLRISSRDAVWGTGHYFQCVLCFDNTLYPGLNHLLHKNLSPTPPSSNSVTRQPTTTRTTAKRRRNSTEYSAIQEDGFQHSMGAVSITYLLSSLFCFKYFMVS